MSQRERTRLFALSAVAVCAVATVAWLLDRPAPAGERPLEASAVAKVVPSPAPVGAPQSETAAPPHARPVRKRHPRANTRRQRQARAAIEAPRAARAFLAGLLRWETEADRLARRRLASSSAPELARLITLRAPRPLAGSRLPSRGRVIGLELVDAHPTEVELQATILRSGRPSGLLLSLRRRAGRWLVHSLR